MKVICIRQPYASRIAWGLKTIEVRSWSTAYRGELLISATGKDYTFPRLGKPVVLAGGGYAIATVVLADVRPLLQSDCQAAFMKPEYWEPGLYAWVFRNPQVIVPFKVQGKLCIFEVQCKPVQLVESEGKEHSDLIFQLRSAKK